MRRISANLRTQPVPFWSIVFGLALVVSGFLIAHYAVEDGVRRLIFPYFFEDTTVYPPQYEETTFENIQVGANMDDVVRSLGPPLEQDSCDGLVRWRYSKSSSDSHYRVRQLVFSNGRVIRKTAYYYVD